MFKKGWSEASQPLLEAQERLIELRELVRGKGKEAIPLATAHGRSPSTNLQPSVSSTYLPEHIGWGSAPLTRLLRASQTTRHQPPRDFHEHCNPERPAPPARLASTPTPNNDLSTQFTKLYPDIALALLREQLVAPGRLWLLLRHIDLTGRGWIDADNARRQLTKKDAPLRVVGWRQMRKLLARGDGVFWDRDSRRIWLRSPLKVAVALGINHLNHYPVALPLAMLVQSIGLVRAHFYASFHSGRGSEKIRGGHSAPIARATLQALCQTSRRTQRAYERRAGVQKQRNFAVGKTHTVADHQNQAWDRGRAVFQITDHSGRAGREGATYTAWQLPNSYRGPHEKQPKGRQKRMNRKLADLFMKGMTGNGERANQAYLFDGDSQRRFFDNGAAAITQYNRGPDSDIYWPCRTRTAASHGQQSQLWHSLPRQEGAWGGKSNNWVETRSGGSK